MIEIVNKRDLDKEVFHSKAKRFASFGVKDINAKLFAVNVKLIKINKSPIK